MVQRAERVVHLLAHHRMAKHTHQVVAEHGYPQRRLCRPEVPQYETAQSKVSLELLDPVLAICPSTVQLPHLQGRNTQIGQHKVDFSPEVSLFGCRDTSDCTSQRCWEPKARTMLSPMRLNFLSDDIDRGGDAGVVTTHEESVKKNQVLSVLR